MLSQTGKCKKMEKIRDKSRHRTRRAEAAASTNATEDGSDTEKVLENIVAMVKQCPAGLPLKKLAVSYNQTYHNNLTLSSLGFDSIASLVSSMDRDLILEGQVVYHKDHRRESRAQAGAGSSAKAAQDKKMRSEDGEVLENVVALLKEHPDGIPLKKMTMVYSQKYHHNLAPASLGFKSIADLVASLGSALVVRGKVVFHKSQLPVAGRSGEDSEDSRPATPLRTETVTAAPSVTAPQVDVSSHQEPPAQAIFQLFGPPLISTASPLSTHCLPVCTPVIAPKLAAELTKEQLYQRVVEVIKKYQLSAPTMDQLQIYYMKEFDEQFPLTQYKSVYNSWEASNSSLLSETSAAAQHHTREPVKQQQQQQQQTAVPSFLSNSDFPALSTDVPISNGPKSKAKVASNREGGGPVFREAYHAQLREVHGGNMRAVEAMEEDEEELSGRKRKKFLDPNMVSSLMEDVTREIAAEGELVTKEKVISRVCQLLQIPSLEAAKMKPWQIPALKNLQYIIREINMFIESTEAVTSICTLYELGQSLAGLKDKKHYEELHLGPLCRLPVIHRMFKIDSNTKDDDIHQIETVDILKQLRIYRRQHSKPKVDLAEFMKYLADHYNCDSPYELGIRIHSVGLPISTLMKVSRCEYAILEQAREAIQKELEEETYERLRKIKKSVLEPLQGAGSFSSTGSLDLRKKYASMQAADVVLAVFTNADGVFNPRMAKQIQSFLLQVSDNRLARALFQLAICGGSLAVPPDLVPKDKASKTAEQPKAEDRPSTCLPSEAKVKQYVKDSLSSQNSAFTLAHMASLERKLTKHFQLKHFLCLEQGNFLEFLVKHVELLQDSLGSTVILASGTVGLAGSGFRPTRQDVFEFINQCGDITSTDPDELSHIESALRSHYKVRDSRDLGYGTLHMLAGLVQRQRGLAGGGLNPVYYESALFAKHCKSSAELGGEAVGRLGEMSKNQALASLLSCPLLEDLSEWSQWELIFKPLHGSLKEFIERNAANTGLAALEVTPGLLLRITTHTGDKHFSSAAVTLDPIGTAGHLVSMVVADGIVNAPTALLANHMKSSLAAAVAEEVDLSQAEEDVSCYSRVARFILACLTRIPTRICQALLQQVFLEPFSHVLGQAKSKEVLMTVAQSDPRHMNRLHRLGILLGITDWVKNYQKKLNPPQSQTSNAHTAPVEKAKSNLIDSESSSLSALNTSEDENLEDTLDFSSSHLNQSPQQVNGVEHAEVEEGEDEEELYELSSLPNGETSDVSSEAGGDRSEGQSETSDSNEKDAASCESETSLEIHRALIEDIRKTEFGVGVELTAEGQKLMQVHQDRLGRSLDRLSTELYSKDTHFVLELIQVASLTFAPLKLSLIVDVLEVTAFYERKYENLTSTYVNICL